MAAPFAKLEVRLNQAVISHLANVTADFGNGLLVDGVFDNRYVESLGVVAGTQPVLLCQAADIPNIVRNSMVTVQGTAYNVADIQPDGVGMKLLVLEK